MATVKLLLRVNKGKQLSNGNYPIIIRVVKDRAVAEISTGYNCDPKYWDPNEMQLKSRPKHPNYSTFQKRLNSVLFKAKNILYDLDDLNPNWTVSDFKVVYKNADKKIIEKGTPIIPFLDQYIELLKLQGKFAQADNFSCLRTRLITTDPPAVYFEDVTIQWLDNLKMWYARQNQSGRNTFRNLRILFNHARRSGNLKKEVYPFGEFGFSIPAQPKTEKGISFDQLKQIYSYKGHPQEELAIKYFLLMTFLIGIEWIDLCTLRMKNYVNGRIEFTRAKTGKFFSIEVIPQAHHIIVELSLAEKPSDLLLPILTKDEIDNPRTFWRRIQAKRNQTNKWLGKVKIKLGIQEALTTKVSKYTWASVARNEKNLPITIIQDAFGHTDNRVTDKYAKTRGHKHTDDVNKKLWIGLK